MERAESWRPLQNAIPFLAGAAITLLVVGSTDRALAQQACDPPTPGDVVINEIGFQFEEADLEYVELYNRSACTVALAQLTLSDARGTREVVQHQPPALDPGGYAVLALNGSAFSSAFPGVAYSTVGRWPALNNGGDAVVIHVAGQRMDSVYYSASWGTAGRSLEKRNPHVLTHSPSNWGASTHEASGTPGAVNSLFAMDEEPPSVLYAEQEARAVLYVRLSEAPAPDHLHSARFRVNGQSPERIEYADTDRGLRLLFRNPLDGHDLEVSGLRDISGNEAPAHRIDIALFPEPGTLVLNEIMFDPITSGAGGQPEYVEIVNRSTRLRSLRGVRLAEDAAEDGARPGTLLQTERVALHPGGYAVAYASNGPSHFGSAPPPEFAVFGSDAGTTDVMWIGLRSVSPRGLSNGGELLVLENAAGEVIDAVRFDPTLHSLTLREFGDTRGTALERRSPDVETAAGATWTSSVARTGGTPGRINSVALAPSTGDAASTARLRIEPSPFSPDDDGHDDVAVIHYRLRHEAAAIRVRVFDMNGRPIRVLTGARFAGAEGQLVWDGRDDQRRPLRTGIYVVVLEEVSAEHASIHRHRALVTVVK